MLSYNIISLKKALAKGVHPNPAVIILNVDTDVAARRRKSDTLRSAGYTVTEAATAGEACQQNQTERPTVIILDMRHAAEETLILGRRFKAAVVTIPILLLAPASIDPVPWEDSADICLREPFTPAQFLSQVRVLVRLAQGETAQLTLSTFLEHVPEGVTLTGGPPDFPIIANSRLARELIGRPAETLVGLPAGHHVEAYGLLLADGVTRPTPEQMPLYRATRLGETISDEEWVIQRPDGSAIIVLVNVVPIRDAAGRVSGAINCWHDISKHKQIEGALRRANERFRLAEAAANGFVYDWDFTTGQVKRTDGITRLLGYLPQEMNGEPGWWRGLMHPEDRESIASRGREALATHDSYIFEYRVRHRDRHYVDVLDRGIILRDGVRQVLRIIGSVIDITERKRTEETLRRSEQRLALALEAGRMGLWEWDVIANRSVWNEREYELLGLPVGDGTVDSTLFFKHVQTEDLPQLRRTLTTVLEQVDEFKQAFRIVRPDGAVRWLMGIGRAFPDADGHTSRMVGINYDITEQKQIEMALKRSEERAWAQAEEISALLSAAPAIIFTAHDPDCHAITGNRAAYELLRMPPGINLSKTAPEGDLLPHFKVLVQGVELPPENLPVQRAARGIEVRDFEEEIVFDDGARLHLYGNATPLRDLTGKVRGAIAAFVDITERKQAEEALREANRRKDEFLAMLAHELRNPLAPIRNAVQILQRLGPAEPKQQWARDVIARQVGHLARLVDDLLDVSRLLRGKITLQRTPLMLSALVQHAVETSRPLIEARRQTLEIKLPPEPVRLEGDLTRLAQVLANLLNNAAKYTDEGGHIGLEAETCHGEVIIRVWDTGVGIAASLLPHVFDLFTQAERTLDRSQGGLGLGLTVVKNMVNLHGGKVEARSDGPGCGSEFIVHLPIFAMTACEHT